MANVLVTGGAGFVGSNLVDRLVELGHTVRVFDNYSTGKRENLDHLFGKIDFVEGDLVDLNQVTQAVQDIEIIFHQGAVPSVPKSVRDPIGSNRANVNGTLNVLVAAKDAGVRRVVYASSSSVYGDQAPDLAKVETMLPGPISPYGVAKLAAEQYCRAFYHTYGLETVSLRYFNVFGPRQDPDSQYAAVIPLFITALLRGESPTIYGDGEQTRDFTYIGNVVEGNILAATTDADRVAGEIFNLAAGGQTSLNTLIEMLQEVMGSDIKPIYADPRTGDIKHSRADVGLAHERMGYEAAISFMDGLQRSIQWYRQQHAHPAS